MMDLPVTVAQFPVKVKYRDRRFVYGRDYGIVSLVDGMVHFHGQRSHFSLPQATLPGFEWIQPTDGFNEANEVRVTSRITVTGWEQRVDISFLRKLSPGLLKSRHRLDFSEALLVRFAQWKHTEPVEGVVYRLPPQCPNQEALHFSKWEAIPVLALACIGIPLTVALGVMASFQTNGVYPLHLLAPASIAAVTAGYFLCWWVRRRRLIRMLTAQANPEAAQRAANEADQAEETEVVSLRG
jgi:hypothetical protein